MWAIHFFVHTLLMKDFFSQFNQVTHLPSKPVHMAVKKYCFVAFFLLQKNKTLKSVRIRYIFLCDSSWWQPFEADHRGPTFIVRSLVHPLHFSADCCWFWGDSRKKWVMKRQTFTSRFSSTRINIPHCVVASKKAIYGFCFV